MAERKGMLTPGRKQRAFDYADPDGTEPVSRYACAIACPACGHEWLAEDKEPCPECGGEGEWQCAVRRLGEQAGERPSGARDGSHCPAGEAHGGIYGTFQGNKDDGKFYPKSKGTCARFYPNPDWSYEVAERLAASDPVRYCAKSSRGERDAGLDSNFPEKPGPECGVRTIEPGTTGGYGAPRRNPHPTVKPISLLIWLCRLLAPPPEYAPRRLLVPFAGSGSEVAAAILSGCWEEIIGIELLPENAEIARARCEFWQAMMQQTGLDDPKAILKAAKSRDNGRKAKEPEHEQLELLEQEL